MSYMLENDPYAGDPEREHNDHVAGMAEFQAAFQASCAETVIRDDSAKVAASRKSGKWVAVYNADIHCRHTDAVIGMSTELVGVFDNRDDALKAIGGEDECACVLPPVYPASAECATISTPRRLRAVATGAARLPMSPAVDDDIPF